MTPKPVCKVNRRNGLRHPSGWFENLSGGDLALLLGRKVKVGDHHFVNLSHPAPGQSLPQTLTMQIGHKPERDDAFAEQPGDDTLTSRSLSPKPVILLVEEELGVRKMLDMFLRLQGLSVYPVASGREALAVYEQHHAVVPLVFLDVGMKGLDGPQTLAALREIDPNVTFCFTTGGAEKYTDDQLRQQRPNWILHKPFNLAEVLAIAKMACPGK